MRRRLDVDENNVITLTPIDATILRAQLTDGASTEAVARRIGYARNTVNRALSDIARAYGMSRMEMVVAFLKGDISFEEWDLHGGRNVKVAA